MTLIVREVRLEDAGAIINILNPIIATNKYSVLLKPLAAESHQAYIQTFPERGVYHVALAGEHVVGLQTVEPTAYYTTAFDHVGDIGTFVNLDLRGRGIAKTLFAATFERAQAKGYEKLIAQVRSDNPIALKTYQAQGFNIISTAKRHAKINGQYIDEIFIEKFLT
jgi:L-amino acid N-acyltransferase YncA